MENKRTEYRKELNGLYLPYYDGLCTELPPEWQPYCGQRGPDEQEIDFAKGVSKAHAWESPHQYGLATDWTLWDESGKPIWIPKRDPRWRPYIEACVKVGVMSGSTWDDYFHNEYKISVHWTKVKEVYEANGLDAAMQYIQQVHTA